MNSNFDAFATPPAGSNMNAGASNSQQIVPAFAAPPNPYHQQAHQQAQQAQQQSTGFHQMDPFAPAPQSQPQMQTQPTAAVSPFMTSTPAPAPTRDMLVSTDFAAPSVIAPSASQDDQDVFALTSTAANNNSPSSYSNYSSSYGQAQQTTTPTPVSTDLVATDNNTSGYSQEFIKAQEDALARFKRGQSRARSVTPPRGALVQYNGNANGNGRSLSAPRTRNPNGSDAVHPEKKTMKQQRKAKTVAGVAGGVVFGTLVAGPVGLVLGGPIGGYAANKISKNGERRAQRRFEQNNFQQAAKKSAAAKAGAFA